MLAFLLVAASLTLTPADIAAAADPVAVETRVASGDDDVEESAAGVVSTGSSDLELTLDPSRGEQTVGIRLTGVSVPRGVHIDAAWIQFQVDEVRTDPTTLTIAAQAIDDAPPFASVDFDVSSRAPTSNTVGWSPPVWNTVGEAGPDQQTPSLVPIIQELVDRPGWTAGNAIAIIITGSGRRTVESYNGIASAAPLLHIEYSAAVSVEAVDSVAAEDPSLADDGVFRFTRSGPTDQAVTVSYTVGGSATPDVDYVALSGTVVMGVGQQSADVTVTALADQDVEASETVDVTVVDGPGYSAGSPASATVTVLDAGLPIVSVTATDPTAIEGADPADDAGFTFTRSGPTDGALTVVYTVAGDATADSDYVALTGNVLIPAGQTSNTVGVVAIDDAATEPPETVTVTLTPDPTYGITPPGSASATIIDNEGVVDVRIAASHDDAEEDATGNVSRTGRDLTLGSFDVGLRFIADVPQGATVTGAWVQFQVHKVSTSPSTLTIAAQSIDDAPTFSNTPFDISTRSLTSASVAWSVPPWDTDRVAGPDQQTPELAAVVQEVIDRPGWVAGNAIALVISGSGARIAESFDRDPAAGPLLHLEFAGTGTPANRAPTVEANAESVTFPQAATVEATVADDLLPAPPSAVTTTWSQVSGPGTVTFANANAKVTTATFSAPGVYELQVTADDGALAASDTVLLSAVDPDAPPPATVTFAAIGDYGAGCCEEGLVASMVAAQNPDFIITLGDNRYVNDADYAVGQFYADYIGGYTGTYGLGSPINRFFPAIGNHDYSEFGGIDVYLDYFTLPGGAIPTSGTSGNERYYDFIQGPVHFFVLNSDGDEPDGRSSTSIQAQWLETQLAASTSPWQIVYLHHAPFSSGASHGPNPELQWPFEAWGADAVLAGHEHTYERLQKGGIPYFVNGVGGQSLHAQAPSLDPDSQFFYNADYGAMFMEACAGRLAFEFHSISAGLADSHAIGAASCTGSGSPPVAADDAAATAEDVAVVVDVVANDTDPDGDLDPTSATTTCGACAPTSSGTLINNGDGTFDYTPNANFHGVDSFVYQVCDLAGQCDVATASITINPVNDPPVAADDSASTTVGAAVAVDVIANDSDVDGDPLTVTNLGTPTNGVVFDNGDGTVTYTPDPGYTGDDAFTYTANDGTLDSNPATVSVTIGAATQTVDVRVAAGSDDAEERGSGSVSLTSSDLELVVDGNRGPQTVGLRFTGVDVPAGASITEAWVQFQADETDSGAANLVIEGQADVNPPTFSNTSGNIVNRPRTAASVAWSPPAWDTVGEAGAAQRTPDLAAVVQEIVNQGGWASGNALVLIVTGDGVRTAESYNGVAAAAPLLHIEYSSEPVPNRAPVAVDDAATTQVDAPVVIDVVANDSDPDGNLDPASTNVACAGCSTPANGALTNLGNGAFDYAPSAGFTGSDGFVYEVCDVESLCDMASVSVTVTDALPQVIEVRVAASSDDAEERANGTVALTSSDLELVTDGNRGVQTVGLRFLGVGIPAGATITAAWVQFQVDETDSVATDLVVSGQADANPVTFANVNGDISGRPRTASTAAWSPAAWNTVGAAGADQQTTDLSEIVQEIVTLPGWTAGNPIVLIFTGTGQRTAESFNGSSSGAPLLHIEYVAP